MLLYICDLRYISKRGGIVYFGCGSGDTSGKIDYLFPRFFIYNRQTREHVGINMFIL